jgi:hypothetical protein
VNFEETVRALAELSAHAVDLEIWGNDDGAPVAFFTGDLRRMPDFPADEPPPIPADAIGETAATFLVGEGNISLWPSRFVGAERLHEGRGWVEVQTKDALIRIGLKRRPWID